MAIGKRIRFFRKKRELTQKELGILAGYPEKSADIRVAQYENGSRHPKQTCVIDFARILAVSPDALDVPNIDNTEKLMHTLFALEDLYGIRIGTVDGEPFLFVDKTENKASTELNAQLLKWSAQAEKLETGQISRLEYDHWRYYFSVKSIPAVNYEPQQNLNEKVGNFLKNRTKKSKE